jgi:hypothetical protein
MTITDAGWMAVIHLPLMNAEKRRFYREDLIPYSARNLRLSALISGRSNQRLLVGGVPRSCLRELS